MIHVQVDGGQIEECQFSTNLTKYSIIGWIYYVFLRIFISNIWSYIELPSLHSLLISFISLFYILLLYIYIYLSYTLVHKYIKFSNFYNILFYLRIIRKLKNLIIRILWTTRQTCLKIIKTIVGISRSIEIITTEYIDGYIDEKRI